MEQHVFPDGADVEITAIGDPNWNFDHWGGDGNGSDNPFLINMNADKTVVGTFLENPPPPPTTRILTLDSIGQGSFSVREITPPTPGDHYYGREWSPGEATRIVEVHPNGESFNPGEIILLRGYYNGSWDMANTDGVIFLFENFGLDGMNSSGRAFSFDNLNNCEWHSVNKDNENCRLTNFTSHFVFGQESHNLFFDGVNVLTATNSGQTDGVYIQRCGGHNIVANSKFIIQNTNTSAHCDFIQGLDLIGDRTYQNNIGVHSILPFNNRQGIFDELQRTAAGKMTAIGNHFTVGRGGIVSRNKNHPPALGTAEVKFNTIIAPHNHHIWMDHIVSANVSDNIFLDENGNPVGGDVVITN